MVASGQSCSPVAGAAGIVSLSIIRDLNFAAGVHTLGVFGKVVGGVSAAAYLTVPAAGQKILSVSIVG
jgi:hypothetical protein